MSETDMLITELKQLQQKMEAANSMEAYKMITDGLKTSLALYDAQKTQKPGKRPIGFAKGAEVPASFFEPLPEEDLQLWGL